MEFRGTSAQQSARPEHARPAGASHTARPPEYQEKSSKGLVIVAIIAVIVVLVVAVMGMMMFKQKHGGAMGVKKDQYQAVFLTNGQVYFGKIDEANHDHLTLSNIYYLQVQQNVQPADKDKDAQVSLAKLGDELHAPEDKMFISRDQVLFWENLKNDGKVVQAISQHQSPK